MKIRTKALEKQWFKFKEEGNEAEFCIRPFPFSQFKMDQDNMLEHLWEQFDYCVLDWKGLSDEDDKPFKCNQKNKKVLFDYSEAIREFVYEKARALADNIVAELKN